MPGDDNANIPTSVFTRTESRGHITASQPQSAPLSPSTLSPNTSGSTGDTRPSVMEDGGRGDTLFPGGVPDEKKMDEILSCLEGTLEPSVEGQCYEVDDEDRVVDLWHLRHLALSRGGLMTPGLRKRAWPKLVGVDEHILTTTSASLPAILQSSGASITSCTNSEDENQNDVESTVELTNKDIKVVKQDIGRCVWHVEYHIKMLRKQREKNKGGDHGNLTDTDTALAHVSTFSNTGNHNNQGDSIESPETGRPQHRSKREMGLILNIITAVLRSVPEGEEKSRLHYFQGLHDVAALFLINLESPSLTSLVMKRLCHLHFRDAMRPNFKKVQIILQAVITPLLEIVDRELHDYIIHGGTDDSSVFALSWILTWFAHDIQNFDVVSRLFDVFLVSHPLFPAYLSVGLLTHPVNRKLIMSTNCEFSALYETICDLPKKMTQNPEESEVMNQFEDCIQLSLTFIRDCPPSKLITLAREYRGGYLKEFLTTAPSVFLLEAPPRWAIAPTAPTDWSLIKLAKLMRGQSAEARLARRRCLRLRHFVEKIDLNSDEHEIALIAFGLDRGGNSRVRRFRISKANGLIGILFLLGALYGNEYYRGPTFLSNVLPSTSLIKVVSETLKKSARRPRTSKVKPKVKPKAKPKLKPAPLIKETASNVPSHTQNENQKDTRTALSSDNLSGRKEPITTSPVKTGVESILTEIDDLKQAVDDVDDKYYVVNATSQESIDIGHIPVEKPTQVEEDRKDHTASTALPPSDQIRKSSEASILPAGTDGESAPVEIDLELEDTSESKDGIIPFEESIDAEIALKDISTSDQIIIEKTTSSADEVDEKSVPDKVETDIDELGEVKEDEDDRNAVSTMSPSEQASIGKETIAEPMDIEITLDNMVANVSPSDMAIDEVPKIIPSEETIDNKIALEGKPLQTEEESKELAVKIILQEQPIEAYKAPLDTQDEARDNVISGMVELLNREKELRRDITEEFVPTNLSPVDLVAKIFEKEIAQTEHEIRATKETEALVDLVGSIFHSLDAETRMIDNDALREDLYSSGIALPSSGPEPKGQKVTDSSLTKSIEISRQLPKKKPQRIQTQEDGDSFGIVIDQKKGNLKVIDHLCGGIRMIKTVFRWWLLNEELVFF